METLLLTEKVEPVLLLTDQRKRARPTLLRLPVHVPVGFELPEGMVVTQAFDLTVEAGVRWHPEWGEPRVTINAFRFFPHGDCLCWSGNNVVGFPLPEEALALMPFHGQALNDDSRKAVERAGLDIPEQPETLASFLATPLKRTIH